MTTGATGDSLVFSAGYVGSGFRKTWSGSDGRLETGPNGKPRMRWNNYTVVKASRRRTSSLWSWTATNGTTGTSVGANNGYNAGIPPDYGRLEFTAQSRLTEALRDHSFNLAVNAAQSRQLVDMVVSNLSKLARSMRALKRGDFATAARQLGASPRTTRLKPSDISGRWLELQYGWLPALSDTHEAAKAYEVITKEARRFTVRSSAKRRLELPCQVDGASLSTEIWQQRVSYRYELLEQLSAARSLGLLDPLSVAWEILPYSFVIDWFIPIGGYLDNLSILPTLSGRWMKTRSSVVSDGQPLRWNLPLPGFYFGGIHCAKVQYLGVDVKRAVNSDRFASTGGIVPTLPNFDSSGLHGKRVWNAIALAQQSFRR